MKFLSRFASVLLAAAALVHGTDAQAYTQIIAFGDSLSDNGNLYSSVGLPRAPYYDGRFSNGPVAVEVMAQQLGLSLTDYAIGGAFTNTGNLAGPILDGTGMASQIHQFSASLQATGQTSADASALYFVWGGANNFFAGRAAVIPVTASNAANDIKADIVSLYSLGARDFFVPLLPDLGLTPWAYENVDAFPGGLGMVATNDSLQFNGLLTTNLNRLRATLPGIHIQTFDTLTFMRNQLNIYAAAGYNVQGQCFSGSYSGIGTACNDPNDYAFWDDVHPSAVAHQALGQAFADSVATVPEPASWLLMLSAALTLTVWSKRRQVGRGMFRIAD